MNKRLRLIIVCFIGFIAGTRAETLTGIGYIYGTSKPYSTLNQINKWNDASLTAIKGAHATATGASINWCDVERVQGQYNWTVVDAMVSSTVAAGLTAVTYTGNTPDWALPPQVLAKYGPGIGYRFPPSQNHTDSFVAFFTAVATRYRGKLKMYEFWNEPNGCSWVSDNCSNGNSYASYTAWLKVWAKAMKAGDPTALLSVGGLDCNAGVPDCASFLAGVYSSGGGPYFDAVAIHPYGASTDPSSCIHWAALNQTLAVLEANGDGSKKKVWVNEWGWNTADEQAKAKAVTAALSGFQSYGDALAVTLYLTLTDLPGKPDSADGFGLCSQNTPAETVSPRPSYDAFKAFLS